MEKCDAIEIFLSNGTVTFSLVTELVSMVVMGKGIAVFDLFSFITCFAAPYALLTLKLDDPPDPIDRVLITEGILLVDVVLSS